MLQSRRGNLCCALHCQKTLSDMQVIDRHTGTMCLEGAPCFRQQHSSSCLLWASARMPRHHLLVRVSVYPLLYGHQPLQSFCCMTREDCLKTCRIQSASRQTRWVCISVSTVLDTSNSKFAAGTPNNCSLAAAVRIGFAMQTSGNEIFYRNPYDVNECLFVNLSSPSSSRYKSVRSIGPPDVVAEKARRQYLRDMMSTRLGVKRETNVVSASDRIGPDGNEYYDLQVQHLRTCQFEVFLPLAIKWHSYCVTN